MANIARIVALGASNLKRGFCTVVSEARAAWGPEIQVLAAHGYGRSYGAPSTVIFRTLPGILDSSLWRTLESMPSVPTRALITDVGNDILYGYSVEQIIAWVDEALIRLHRVTQDIILTCLPLASIQRLSPAKYLVLRSIMFPPSRLSLLQMHATAEQVNAELIVLAKAHNAKFFQLNPAWYGLDPIHIRSSLQRSAWRRILDVPPAASPGSSALRERWKLHFMHPELRWILGIPQHRPQSGASLPGGGRVWLY
jgi:hypothetical protein